MTTQITPGQKLKDGDWFHPKDINELKQIQEASNVGANWYKDEYLQEIISEHRKPVYLDRFGMIISCDDNGMFTKQEYSFEAFKELCENTFGDGNK